MNEDARSGGKKGLKTCEKAVFFRFVKDEPNNFVEVISCLIFVWLDVFTNVYKEDNLVFMRSKSTILPRKKSNKMRATKWESKEKTAWNFTHQQKEWTRHGREKRNENVLEGEKHGTNQPEKYLHFGVDNYEKKWKTCILERCWPVFDARSTSSRPIYGHKRFSMRGKISQLEMITRDGC